MPEREVVSNTSPLLYLHQVGQLGILARLYGRILIPPAVRAKLETGRDRGISVPVLERHAWIESCVEIGVLYPPCEESIAQALTLQAAR